MLDRFGRRFCVLIDEAHPANGRLDAHPGAPPTDVVVMSGTVWRDLYDVATDGIVVVRPDGHIAARPPSSLDPLEIGRTLAAVIAEG